jgi:DNA-binding MarR family transcriptional regulator
MTGQQTITQIYQEIEKIRLAGSNGHTSAERNWLLKRLDDDRLKERVATISVTGLHMLSALQTQAKTGIELADELQVTRGGITRAAKKLLAQQLVTAVKKKNNQKKIYYQLTAAGKKVAVLHDQLHQDLQAKVINELEQEFSPANLQTVAKFLHKFNECEQDL